MNIRKWKKQIRKQLKRNQRPLLFAGICVGAAAATTGLVGILRRVFQ